MFQFPALCLHQGGLRPPLKQSLFPVQQVAKIVASWAAAKKKILFFIIYSFVRK